VEDPYRAGAHRCPKERGIGQIAVALPGGDGCTHSAIGPECAQRIEGHAEQGGSADRRRHRDGKDLGERADRYQQRAAEAEQRERLPQALDEGRERRLAAVAVCRGADRFADDGVMMHALIIPESP